MKIFRQGDVIGIRVAKLPAGATLEPGQEQKVVLAYGEVTFHSHQIAPEHVPNVRLWTAKGERFLQVLVTSELRHEEHSTVTLLPGIYEIPVQVEYSSEHVRQVQD